MARYWRPLTQKELPDLSSGDLVVLRKNYLSNPDRLPVAYVEAKYVAKVKRAVIRVLEKGCDTATCVGLTEVGWYVDDGWKMTQKEWQT
jgi:hypothetical protein